MYGLRSKNAPDLRAAHEGDLAARVFSLYFNRILSTMIWPVVSVSKVNCNYCHVLVAALRAKIV